MKIAKKIDLRKIKELKKKIDRADYQEKAIKGIATILTYEIIEANRSRKGK